MKAHEFDEKFAAGEDILAYLDLDNSKRVLQQQQRIQLNLPVWMIESLDKEASRIGVTRQSIIKLWLAERLESRAMQESPTN